MPYCYHCMTKLSDPTMPFCPECGQKHNTNACKENELIPGTVLSKERYLVGECISSDDFMNHYIGFDFTMNRKVIINEVFYKGLFKREQSSALVSVDSKASVKDIEGQVKSECILLAEFDAISNIVKTYDWFSENNTVYIVTEYIGDCTLLTAAQKNGGCQWSELYPLLKPLLEALLQLHTKGIVHKNINPKNIVLRRTINGKELVLTGFGMARPDTTSGKFDFSTDPYCPPEKRNYSENDWINTDIYSIAATIYTAITAQEPIDKITKDIDEAFPLLKPYRREGKIPDNVYYALKYALQPAKGTRCKTIETFMSRLEPVQQSNSDIRETTSPASIIKNSGSSTAVTAPKSTASGFNAPVSQPFQELTQSDVLTVQYQDSPNEAPVYNNYAGNPNAAKAVQPTQKTTPTVSQSDQSNSKLIPALIGTVCILFVALAIMTILFIGEFKKNHDSESDKSDNAISVQTPDDTTSKDDTPPATDSAPNNDTESEESESPDILSIYDKGYYDGQNYTYNPPISESEDSDSESLDDGYNNDEFESGQYVGQDSLQTQEYYM